ncbi:hypothetical protein IDM40_15730 [Nocardiopsis sp. HNM0947]|uniref:Uncharacterized protein n=1 Tax=Nocardiopsis coralli TaxID=2772213 RepID=A0ABR9P8G9_9ACTN|nr:hypothetical protein [Nocardiopsis coralli]MBE3000143.1 hypothetical protein [Nocardiopsis coralli]
MTDLRTQHEATVAYDALNDSAHALQARYISLSRDALGDPQQQEAWNARVLNARDAVAEVDPDNLKAIETLTEQFRRELRELKDAG